MCQLSWAPFCEILELPNLQGRSSYSGSENNSKFSHLEARKIVLSRTLKVVTYVQAAAAPIPLKDVISELGMVLPNIVKCSIN